MTRCPPTVPSSIVPLSVPQGFASRLVYNEGQRLCFISGEFWQEGVVERSPVGEGTTHLLKVHYGGMSSQKEVDLDEHSHMCIPLYAYDVGHPLEVLIDWPPQRRGEWARCVVAYREPGCNQYVVRQPPFGQAFWQPLLPWNHRSMPFHASVPIWALRTLDESAWKNSAVAAVSFGETVGEEPDREEDDDDVANSSSIQIDLDQRYDFALNAEDIGAKRGRFAGRFAPRPMWTPARVVAIHARTAARGSKSCDLVAGGYRFDAEWGTSEEAVRLRQWSSGATAVDAPAEWSAWSTARVNGEQLEFKDGASLEWQGNLLIDVRLL